MSIDPIDSVGQPTGGRRRTVAIAMALGLIAVVGAAGFGIGRAFDGEQVRSVDEAADDSAIDARDTDGIGSRAEGDAAAGDGGDSAAAPSVPSRPSEPSEADAADVSPSEQAGEDGPVPAGNPATSPAYMPSPLETVYERTIDGVRYRVQRGEPADGQFVIDEVDGWQPPAFCWPAAEGRITVDGPTLVDVAHLGWYTEIYGEAVAGVTTTGFADGAPRTLLLVQTVQGATSARVDWPAGPSDQAVVDGGVALLVVPGVTDPWQVGDVVVEVATPEGTVTVPVGGPAQTDDEFRAACSPPPPALPAAGAQPDDPDIARAQLTERFAALWDPSGPRGEGSDLLDDWTGVLEAIDAALTGSTGEAAAAAVHVVEEIVFTSPSEAWFRYRIETPAGVFDQRFGTATSVDGVWQFPRAVACQDLALAGAPCDPPVEQIHPSGFHDEAPEIVECTLDDATDEPCELSPPGR